MNNTRFRHYALGLMVIVAFASPSGFFSALGRAAPVAQMTSSGDAIEISYPGEGGTQFNETIPVYHAGKIRYFSTGVGLEERTAQYPRFPLKLVFVVGAKAYLSQVAVTITDEEGGKLLDVPAEKVTGPWLFVDIPPGTYKISGSGPNGVRAQDRITIASDQVKTVYLRWKGEGAAR